MSISKHLQDKLALLPDLPGCYIMKDENQNILYVGKAKVLKNRVRSYFHGTHNNKTTRLVSHIRDFEFIVTGSEKEALLLEINLIKKHTPPYNIMFMDDKMYVKAWRDYNGLQFIQCACRFTENCVSCGGGRGSKRDEMKELIAHFRKESDVIEKNIFKSVHNINLKTVIGYHKDDWTYNFLDDYNDKK